MKLRHLRPRTPGHRNGTQELETPTSGISPQDYHLLRSPQFTVLEITTVNIKESCAGSIGIIGIQLRDMPSSW